MHACTMYVLYIRMFVCMYVLHRLVTSVIFACLSVAGLLNY